MLARPAFMISARGIYSVLGEPSLRPEARLRSRTACAIATSAILLGSASVVPAEELTVDLDTNKTQVTFVLKDVLHTVHGMFQIKQGYVSLNPDGAMSGNIVVDAASGNSGSSARDKKMTRDILQAQQYPEIRFVPSNEVGPIQTAGQSDIQVSGMFFIHGQSHKITIPMRVQVSETDVAAKGAFDVPYVQWGMKNPSTFLLKVNESVQIEVNALGHIRRPTSTR
jgi:polyisoprenoid-binding protein YceI